MEEKQIKLATEKLRFEGLNKGTIVDFSNVETVEQLKMVIVNNYVLLCRNCTSAKFCKFHDKSEPPCPILEKVVNNYIDMNIKAVETENHFSFSEFIKSIVLLTRVFYHFENWRGIYVDEWFNRYFESVHPSINATMAHELLVDISKFVKAYRVVSTNRMKKFVILVEGESEFVALPSIFSALGVLGINSINKNVSFVNLQGKDSLQKKKIETFLSRYKEEGTSYFLVMDNDSDVKNYIEDLKRARLIEENHYIIWKNKFEDNFSEEALLDFLKDEKPEIVNMVDIEELMSINSEKNDIAKSVRYVLSKNGITFNFDDYKVKIAQKLAEMICGEIETSMRNILGNYDGKRTPTSKSFPEFIKKVRVITDEIKRINSEFHVIKKSSIEI